VDEGGGSDDEEGEESVMAPTRTRRRAGESGRQRSGGAHDALFNKVANKNKYNKQARS
jgi:hypothetical protein